jgi:LmbE family N-acetylglucosaminyl deacetylase
MPYPRLRPLANRIRGVRAPLLYRWGLKRRCVPAMLTDAPLLVVAPHHDDETFGCGGLIALKRRAGTAVQVVFVTDGSQSHRDHALLKIPDVIASRRSEAIAACEILGLSAGELHFLEGPDGQLGEIGTIERSEMVRCLADIVTRSGAAEICVPHHKDCHPDHEATHALLVDAMDLAASDADVLEYPIWLLWKRTLLDWGIRDLRGAERLDVSAAQDEKNRAIDAYGSQLPSMPRGFVPQFKLGEEFFWRHHLSSRCENTSWSESWRGRPRSAASW